MNADAAREGQRADEMTRLIACAEADEGVRHAEHSL